MITFKQYEDTVKKISKKLKISKDHALAALTKIQQKGVDPLKWQQHMTMLQQFTHVVADYKPVDERSMTQMQKVLRCNIIGTILITWLLMKERKKV